MIPVPAGTQIWVACGTTDMRKGIDGLAMLAQEVVKKSPYCGHLFAFRGKRAQLPTFCISFSFCDDCLPLAPVVWAEAAGITVSSRQGIDMHLHERAA